MPRRSRRLDVERAAGRPAAAGAAEPGLSHDLSRHAEGAQCAADEAERQREILQLMSVLSMCAGGRTLTSCAALAFSPGPPGTESVRSGWNEVSCSTYTP